MAMKERFKFTKVNRYLSWQIMSLDIEVSGIFITTLVGIEFIPNGLHAGAYMKRLPIAG